MTDLIVRPEGGELSTPVFGGDAKGMVAYASDIATTLADVIKKQKLSVMISQREYVTVEGWSVLGSMLGFMPQEVPGTVKQYEPGSWEATVELINVRTGTVVGRGSAICSKDEKTWGSRDQFAKRSMAITRATGKAYRLGLGWIMSMAGYEGTPKEEMPEPEVVKTAAPSFRSKATTKVTAKEIEIFTSTDEQLDRLATQLTEAKIPDNEWDSIAKAMEGKTMSKESLTQVLNERIPFGD